MNIIGVTFKAFDKVCREYFVDKTWDQIHDELSDICDTYVPMAIHSTTGEGKFEPLNSLTKFKTETTQ